MTCEDVRVELALYAADEMTEDRPDVERHLASCNSCREELGTLQTTMSTLHSYGIESPSSELKPTVLSTIERASLAPMLSYAVEAPGPKLKRSVMAAVEKETKKADLSARVTDISSRRLRVARLLAAAAILVTGVVVGRTLGSGAPPESQVAEGTDIPTGHETQTVNLQGMGPSTAEVDHYRHDNFRLTFSVEGFEPTPPGFHYAVWVRGAQGDVGIGTFRLKRLDDFDIPFAVGVNPTEYPDLVVTLEPNDGDPRLNGDIVSEGRFDLETVHHGDYNP